MSFKKTLSLSLFLHFCFLAALLLVYADLLGSSSSKSFNEAVIFVKIIENTRESDEGKSLHETKKLKIKESQQIKAEKKPTADIQNKTVSVKAKTAGESYAPLSSLEQKGGQEGNNGRQGGLNIDTEPFGSVARRASGGDRGNNFLSEPSGATEGSKSKVVLSATSLEAIRNSIEKAKTYPFLARKRGIEGTVYISFRVNPRGEPEDIQILNSSGSDILDNATLNIVKKAEPFPSVDNPVEVPVVFRLN